MYILWAYVSVSRQQGPRFLLAAGKTCLVVDRSCAKTRCCTAVRLLFVFLLLNKGTTSKVNLVVRFFSSRWTRWFGGCQVDLMKREGRGESGPAMKFAVKRLCCRQWQAVRAVSLVVV